ncbi:hypothetical protein FDECE_6904 [Fusarium decemcellulare]|nr:hypothetical protein FDECE_6904 [Fusarium decemcellulare]
MIRNSKRPFKTDVGKGAKTIQAQKVQLTRAIDPGYSKGNNDAVAILPILDLDRNSTDPVIVKPLNSLNHTRRPESSMTNHNYDTGSEIDHNRDMLTLAVSYTILGRLEPWKEYFVDYFSRNIATELVPFDDGRNGWRYIVLPLAHLDDLVMDTVLSAAAFHFAGNVNNQILHPDTLYQSAIRKLRERQDLTIYDMEGQRSILLSLLVILVTAMVNGRPDFRTAFGLLEAAVNAIGGETALMADESGIFIIRQLHKYQRYISPLLSWEKGVARLSQSIPASSNKEWEEFAFYYQTHPHSQDSWSLVYSLHEQACNIYVTRALERPQCLPRVDLVSRFISTLDNLPSGSPGTHILPWMIFMAAAESSDLIQQQYFEQVLLRSYERNGFANILMAIWTASL